MFANNRGETDLDEPLLRRHPLDEINLVPRLHCLKDEEEPMLHSDNPTQDRSKHRSEADQPTPPPLSTPSSRYQGRLYRESRSNESRGRLVIARSYTTSVRPVTSDHEYIPLTRSCALSGSCFPDLTVRIAALSALVTSIPPQLGHNNDKGG